MNAKMAVTIVLLVFVGVSAAFLVAKEAGWTGAPAAAPTSPAPAAEGVASSDEPQTIVYYFHTNKRCTKCKNIEAYTKGVIEGDFGQLLADGEMAWKLVNLDEPVNRHFEETFALSFGTVVVAETAGGEVVRFWKLDEVWDLTDDREAFETFIRDEVGAFLEAGE